MSRAVKPAKVNQDDWDALQKALPTHSASASSTVRPSSSTSAADLLADPSAIANEPQMERDWAQRAFQHAETYLRILRITKNKAKLRLTGCDDHIFTHFAAAFPSLTDDNGRALIALTEDAIKNDSAKAEWRAFCNAYATDDRVNDYNFATLLRLDSRDEYHPENVTIVPRIQFAAIEIARNRLGCNDAVTST